MLEFLELITKAYQKLSAANIVIVFLLVKIGFCALGGLLVTYIHSKFSYKWLRNNFNLYVGITLPVIGLIITTVIGSNIALSIGMIGALSIVRFRTPIRTPYELVHYFSLLTIGISAKVDLGITFILVLLLSLLPYLIKRFSITNFHRKQSLENLSISFQGSMNNEDFKKLVGNKNIKNYSVKNEKDLVNVSGYAKFHSIKEKDIFLEEWSKRINSYNVELDENY